MDVAWIGMSIDFGSVTAEDGIIGRYVIYDTETDLYLGQYLMNDPPDRPLDDWGWVEIGMTLGDSDLQPMYLDQYIIRAVATAFIDGSAGFPVGVDIGRFIVDGIGWDRVMIVPIVVGDSPSWDGTLDFGKAFKFEDYV